MEFSWLIFVSVVVVNFLCMGAMLAAQALDKNLPPRHSLIKGTNQEFLYIRDFWTMTMGDSVGISLIVTGFVHLAAQDLGYVWWALPVFVVGTLGFLVICMRKDHKPDYGFPNAGEISIAGALHLFYFGAGLGASVMSVCGLFAGDLFGAPLWVAIYGGAVYLACTFADIKAGNFDPIKRL